MTRHSATWARAALTCAAVLLAFAAPAAAQRRSPPPRASPPPPSPPPPALTGPPCEGTGWTLLFYDDFTNRDTSKWTPQLYDGFQYSIPGWGNSEYEWYTNRTENWFVANSTLNVAARVETDGGAWILSDCRAACSTRCVASGDTSATCVNNCAGTRCADAAARGITSSRLRTYKTFSAGPSAAYPNIRVEARAAMPAGAGLWPAIWMLPEEGATDGCSGCGPYGGWPASGEIDLQESVNGATAAVGTIHYGGTTHQMVSGWTPLVPGTFNLHALEWSAKNMTWSLNGAAFRSANSDQWYSDGAKRSATAPFDRRFHLLVNLAAGGGWPAGDYKGATGVDLTPAIVRDGLTAAGGSKALQIDYIKVCGKA